MLLDSHLTLQGSAVPVVDSYVYLGVKITNSLDLAPFVAARLLKGKALVGKTTPFLTSNNIPLVAKLEILRAVIRPTLCFGGELLGFNRAKVACLSSLLNSALRMTVTNSWGTPSAAVLQREFSIVPIDDQCDAMRTRAITKWRVARTVIASLIASPSSSRFTWVKGSIVALAKRKIHPSSVSEAVREIKANNAARVKCQTGLNRYIASHFALSKGYLTTFAQYSSKWASKEKGLIGLIACRGGNFRTATIMAKAKLITPQFLTQCPCCLVSRPESIRHLFLTCSAWNEERASILAPVLSRFAAGSGRNARTVALLGGTHNPSGLSLGSDWWSGSRALFIHVAHFLAAIRAKRDRLLWSHSLVSVPRSQGAQHMAPLHSDAG